jgi:formylglycine-generating enzyme required for sulfatase activity
MVVVPNGKFTMGSPDSELGHDNDEVQVSVSIAKSFAVGKFAVTRIEFAAFVEETGHKTDGGCYTWSGSERKLQANNPVVCVNWNDANAYAEWLSSKTGKTYRLLSEAEREYVTRAGTTTPFWWGTSITPLQANYNGDFLYAGGGSKGEYRQRTVPVDSFEPNPWGLYNVHGNAWEWTEDCWNASNSGNPGNGSARTTGDCRLRVLRGGSWVDLPQNLRSASRNWYSTVNRINTFGFRLGRTLTP